VRVSLRRYRAAGALAVVVFLGVFSAGTSLAAPGAQPPRFPFCSWWLETTPESANVALPDTSAAYWTTPFLATPGLTIHVQGQFPDARFMSVTVYDNAGGTFTRNGVSSGIVDYQIAPDAGTTNPFQQATGNPGQFTLTIQRDVSPSQSNVLPMVPPPGQKAGNELFPRGNGFIVVRVYLPHSQDFSTVPLPTLSFSRPSGTETLPTCPSQSGVASDPRVQQFARKLHANISSQAAADASGKFPVRNPPSFARPSPEITNSLFPNVASAYLEGAFSPTAGTVVVVQGKAPTFTPDSSALPWPDPSVDLRYWSLCNNEDVSPYPVVAVTDPQTGAEIFGCSADLNTPLVNGQYTYVLSSLADRPPNATTTNGVAWLPYSSDPVDQVLVFRNMLDNGFPNAIQAVPQDDNPASAQQVMGDYYPRMAQCPVDTFNQGGPAACFAASS
jgi:hypothetical protein